MNKQVPSYVTILFNKKGTGNANVMTNITEKIVENIINANFICDEINLNAKIEENQEDVSFFIVEFLVVKWNKDLNIACKLLDIEKIVSSLIDTELSWDENNMTNGFVKIISSKDMKGDISSVLCFKLYPECSI